MRRVANLFVAIAGTIPLLFSACSKKEETPAPAPATNSVPAEERPEAIAKVEADNLPRIGSVHGYIGSEACKQCHKDEHASWYRTYHRTMTQLASTETVVADFKDVVLTNETTRFHLSTNGTALKVKMQPANSHPGDHNVPSHETEMSLVTGSHHMQVFWLPEGNGNLQLGFPFTWLIPEKKWVPRGSTFIRPPDAPHRPEIWNIVCSRCHTTGVEPHVNIAARRADTKVGELGISCEACHGPAEKHVAWRRERALLDQIPKANTKPQPVLVASSAEKNLTDVKPSEDPIVQPRNLSAERSSQVCGFCHSMKWFDRSVNWRETGFKYRPGDDLEQTTPIIRPADSDEIPALAAYLKGHKDVLNDFFWSDGMIRVSGREYNGLLDSPCYKSKEFSCISCHSMHESNPAGMVAERSRNNGACLQCHKAFEAPEALANHTFHSPDSAGSSCYNCHMPHTTYGVLKAIRSHQISSPRVLDQISTGRPNACNLCHLDKTLQWTADLLKTRYGQEIPSLSDSEKLTASGVDLVLKGDAGQRALIAWHLGWTNGVPTTQKKWVAPLLAQLLDDPYAAVRCVAERSWNKIEGHPLKGYDFVVSPKDREPVREMLWEEWAKQSNLEFPEELHLSPSDLNRQDRFFDEALKLRNEKPVRLRE